MRTNTYTSMVNPETHATTNKFIKTLSLFFTRIIMNQHRNAQQNIKRNYTIPTLKSLFRDSDIWHTSNPYIVKCKKIIQRHTEQFNRTLIHNLSGSNLTENQNEVLCKGLGFVFTPTNQNKNPQNSIPDFKRRIDNRLFFKDRT